MSTQALEISHEDLERVTDLLESVSVGFASYQRPNLNKITSISLRWHAGQIIERAEKGGITSPESLHEFISLDERLYILVDNPYDIAIARKLKPEFPAPVQKAIFNFRKYFEDGHNKLAFENARSEWLARRDRVDLEREQRQIRRELILQLRDLLPNHWSKSASDVSAILAHDVNESVWLKAKTYEAREWISVHNLEPISSEQLEVIVDCEHSLRIISRAGSGKTRTIAVKILFLVHYLGFGPHQVLAMVFNKKAAEELRNRLAQMECGAGLRSKGVFRVMTFDSFAYSIVHPQSKIITSGSGSSSDPDENDDGQREFVEAICKDILLGRESRQSLKQELEHLVLTCFRTDWDTLLGLNESTSKETLQQLRKTLRNRSINGKSVRSRPEKRIADFLFEHGIDFIYERALTVGEGRVIRPDFYLPGRRIFIEYYGFSDDSVYNEQVWFKQKFWRMQSNYRVIELASGCICKPGISFFDGRNADYRYLRSAIASQANRHGICIDFQLLSDEEIIKKIAPRIQTIVGKLMSTAISRLSQRLGPQTDLISQIYAYSQNCKWKPEKQFLGALTQVYQIYLDRMANANCIDFSLIKKSAIHNIQAGSTIARHGKSLDWCETNLTQVRYIFVDEFQDFSELFRGLLQSILQVSPLALVNAVGDDWQMINRFAGSQEEIFRSFHEDYPSPRTLYLTTNFRSSPGIIAFCNQIMDGLGKPAKVSLANSTKSTGIWYFVSDDIAGEITSQESAYFANDRFTTAIFRIVFALVERLTGTSKNPDRT